MSGDTIADAFYAAYNGHDVEGAVSLYAEDGWHEEVNSGRRRTGHAALAQGLAGFFEMMGDVRWEERERIRAKGSIAVVYTMTGRFRKDVGPFKAHGQTVTLAGIHVLEIADGRITGSRDFWDMNEFVRQIA